MGKPNKPAKWFKAVKKAFRSPSKDKSGNQDDMKVGTPEKGPSSLDIPQAPHQVPTALPLPSFETITSDEVEPEQTQKLPLPTPEVADLAVSVIDFPEEEEDESEGEDVVASNEVVPQEETKHEVDEDSYVSEEEEAVIRIEQSFADPLALRGLIRVQALVRGHRVRRQAATTLRAMEALVRVQARVRGHCVRMSKEGQAVQNKILRRRQLNTRPSKSAVRQTDGRWDASRGTLQDKNAKTNSREEGARKRERALSYAFSQQVCTFDRESLKEGSIWPFSRGQEVLKLKKSIPNRSSLFIDCEPDQPHWGWSWLERWTAAWPWENHQLEDSKDYIEIIPKLSGSSRKEASFSSSMAKPSGNLTSTLLTSMNTPSSPLPVNEISDWTGPRQSNPTRVPRSLPVPLPSPPVQSPAVDTSTESHIDTKPPPIEVPSYQEVQEYEATQPEPRTPEAQVSAASDDCVSVPLSPAMSDDSLPIPPSLPASDGSSPVPESPPGPHPTQVELSEKGTSAEASEKERDLNRAAFYESPSLLESNGSHEHGEEGSNEKSTPMEFAPEPLYAHSGNGHSETGHSNPSNEEKLVSNGDNALPSSFKPTTCRYMAATESAKAKFRSLSNPKTRSYDSVESPVTQPKRYSFGGAQLLKSNSPNSGAQRSTSFQRRGSPSSKGLLREKSQVEVGAESPARRNSYGGTDGKSGMRWRS